MLRAPLILLTGAALAGCDYHVAGPRTDLEGLPHGLDVSLAVEPSTVSPHESFAIRLVVTNTTDHPVTVGTSHTCLALPEVVRNGERMPFEGTALGCGAALTTHRFAPGERRVHVWEARASLYAEQQGDIDGAPAPKGTYLVRAVFDIHDPDEPGRYPVIGTTLHVR